MGLHRGLQHSLVGYRHASPPSDLVKPHVDRRRSPLAFLFGHFTGPQLGWSTYGKEAFAILDTTIRMHRILATPDRFDLYTDHQKLIFLFDPLAVAPDLSQNFSL